MKRDWEIIRAILLALEESPSANTSLSPAKLPQFPEQEVAYNMRLLDQAGYVKGRFIASSMGDGQIANANVIHMTIAGHELLDTIRSDTVWARTKETFKSKGLDMTFDLVIAVGKKIVESILASP